MLDAIVIGGGPAGLQAALTLGRMHHEVVLLDSGHYRNAAASHLHNFATHDGLPPAEYRSAGRADLKEYATVTVLDAAASAVTEDRDGWRVTAGEELHARTVVLATGLRDTLPPTPGIAELWGDVVAHCPYCHGHELSGRPVAVLGAGPHVPRVVGLVSRVASRVTVLTDGAELDPAAAAQVDRLGAAVRPEPVLEVRRSGAGATVVLSGGPDEEVGGVFVSPTLSQAAPFAADLELEMLPSGCVRIDELGRTSRPGIYAAGDAAHLASLPMPMASVLTAAAAGLVAGSAVSADLLAQRLA